MNCEQVRGLIHGFVDREVGLETSLAIEAHVASCQACANLVSAARAARTSVASAMTYRRAPGALKARIEQHLRPGRARLLRWALAIVPAFAIGLAVGWVGSRERTPMVIESRAPVAERVVYHINNVEAARSALRNLANHIKVSPQAQIVVVAHGTGIDFMLSGARDQDGAFYQTDIAQLRGRGVEFRVCRTTLDLRHIDAARVIPEAVLVPSGIAEVSRLQAREGYAYVRL